MKGRRYLTGLCLLCALAASAIAAQGAAAVTGTTAFTCKKTEKGGAGFSDAHCTSAQGSGASFEHIPIEQGLTTELSGTNANTASGTTAAAQIKLGNTQTGVKYEIVATTLTGIGSVTNGKTESGEHYVHGTAVVTFEGLTVTQPNEKGCKVKEEKITSKELKATTQEQGDFIKFEPASGSTLASYTLEGCAGLNTEQVVTGSIKCPLSGTTITCTHSEVTAQGTLKEGGFKSGVEGAMTLRTRKNSGEEYTPASVTTVTT